MQLFGLITDNPILSSYLVLISFFFLPDSRSLIRKESSTDSNINNSPRRTRKPRVVTIRLRVKDILAVNATEGVVKLNMTVHMWWNDPLIIGKRAPHQGEDSDSEEKDDSVIDWDAVWSPGLSVLNELEFVKEESVFELVNSKIGRVKQKLTILGTITNWMDLRDFPFDEDLIQIQGN